MRRVTLLSATLLLTGFVSNSGALLGGADEQSEKARYRGKASAELIKNLQDPDVKKSLSAAFALHTLGFETPELSAGSAPGFEGQRRADTAECTWPRWDAWPKGWSCRSRTDPHSPAR